MFVYFIEMVDFGMVKIGKSNQPNGRLAALQTALPFDLRFMAVARFDSDRESFEWESKFHKAMGYAHIRGEWFKIYPEIRLLAIGLDVLDEAMISRAERIIRWRRNRAVRKTSRRTP